MEKVLLFLICCMLIGLLKILKQAWTSPAGINILWNIFFIFFAVIVFGNGIEWNYKGVYWLLGSCLVFLIGQSMGENIRFRSGVEDCIKSDRYPGSSNIVYMGVFLVTLFCFAQPVLNLTGYGFKITDFFHLNKLLEVNVTIANARYSGASISFGIIGNLVVVITYFVAVIGGYFFVFSKGKKAEQFICVFTIVPAVITVLIANTKSVLIATILLWASGYLTASHIKYGNQTFISPKTIKIIFVVGVCSLVLFDFVMMLRIGKISVETQNIVSEKLQKYAFGHVSSFAYWYEKGDTDTYDLGSNTFMFLTNWLGITTRQQGVYDFMDGAQTNIFTQNRGIIADYGKLGGMIFWFVWGNIAGNLRKAVVNKRCRYIEKVMLAGIYFSVLYGFIVSPWVYTSYVFAFAMFYIALIVSDNLKIGIKLKGRM